MKKYSTQTGIMWGLRFIAIFFVIFTTLLTFILREKSLMIIYIFSIMIYVMSYLAFMTRITITDKDIQFKSPAISGKYAREELTEIVIYGKRLKFGLSNMDLIFIKKESGQIKNIRLQSNTKLIEELLIHFNGIIKIEAREIDNIKKQLFKLGANKEMF